MFFIREGRMRFRFVLKSWSIYILREKFYPTGLTYDRSYIQFEWLKSLRASHRYFQRLSLAEWLCTGSKPLLLSLYKTFLFMTGWKNNTLAPICNASTIWPALRFHSLLFTNLPRLLFLIWLFLHTNLVYEFRQCVSVLLTSIDFQLWIQMAAFAITLLLYIITCRLDKDEDLGSVYVSPIKY